jgi:hypothetical protein
VKRARPREGTGEARLLHVRVVEHEQAGGHLPGYADLVRDFIAEWKEAGKAWPPPRG